MMDDPIVAEIRKNRRDILESYDWDFEKMSRDIMKRQWESGRKVIRPKKKQLKQGEAPNAYPLRKPS